MITEQYDTEELRAELQRLTKLGVPLEKKIDIDRLMNDLNESESREDV